MSHHVAVRLPDGREAMADYRQPIVHVMQRHNKRLMTDPQNKTGKGVGSQADLDDFAIIAEWFSRRFLVALRRAR